MSKRINISVSDALYEQLKKYPELNTSRICQEALLKAILKRWAEQEQAKLESIILNN